MNPIIYLGLGAIILVLGGGGLALLAERLTSKLPNKDLHSQNKSS